MTIDPSRGARGTHSLDWRRPMVNLRSTKKTPPLRDFDPKQSSGYEALEGLRQTLAGLYAKERDLGRRIVEERHRLSKEPRRSIDLRSDQEFIATPIGE